MIERRPWLDLFCHILLIAGVAVLVFPIWVTLVGSTHTQERMLQAPVPLWFGTEMLHNYKTVLLDGQGSSFNQLPLSVSLKNSFIMALGVCFGKITISLLSAFAIVYFRFPFRKTAFWVIFMTLMLPVEVRIVPTYKVVADLGMLDSYTGLVLPLIASATATFLLRQFFMTVPDELAEAARVDGAGPLRFFFDILLPMSRTSLAALFVIQFIYGWNQYLWPLLITTKESFYTVIMTVSRQASSAESAPQWHLVTAMAILAIIPPILVVMAMQRQFVKGLTDVEK
jgi:sn-glycerol 3-phosphate transport system permease protein